MYFLCPLPLPLHSPLSDSQCTKGTVLLCLSLFSQFSILLFQSLFLCPLPLPLHSPLLQFLLPLYLFHTLRVSLSASKSEHSVCQARVTVVVLCVCLCVHNQISSKHQTKSISETSEIHASKLNGLSSLKYAWLGN